MNYTCTTYVHTSNLTLTLFLHYVEPALIASGIAKADNRGAVMAEEAIAREVEHCMTVACFNADTIKAEPVEMLYQLAVSVKYRAATSDAMLSLHAAMVKILTT